MLPAGLHAASPDQTACGINSATATSTFLMRPSPSPEARISVVRQTVEQFLVCQSVGSAGTDK